MMEYLRILPRSIQWKLHLGIVAVPPDLAIELDLMRDSIESLFEDDIYSNSSTPDISPSLKTLWQTRRDDWIDRIEKFNQSSMNHQRSRYDVMVKKYLIASENSRQHSLLSNFHGRYNHEHLDDDSQASSYCSTEQLGVQRQFLASSSVKYFDIIEKDVQRLPQNHYLFRYAIKNMLDTENSIENSKQPLIDSSSFWLQFIQENYSKRTETRLQDILIQQSRIERGQRLSEILWLYSSEHDNIGYRQGMHEVLSFILIVLEIDLFARLAQVHNEHDKGKPLHTEQEVIPTEKYTEPINQEDLEMPIPQSPHSLSFQPVSSCSFNASFTLSQDTETNSSVDETSTRQPCFHQSLVDELFLQDDAYMMLEALLLRIAPAYDVLDTSHDELSSGCLSPKSSTNLQLEKDDYLMHKVISLGRRLVLNDEDESESDQGSHHHTVISMSSIGTSILNHVRLVAGDEDLYWFLHDLSVPPELYCTRWIRLLLSREVVGWKNVLQLWDFFFEMSSISPIRSKSQQISDNRLGIMELLECAAASMLLLERERLLRQVPLSPDRTFRNRDHSDKIELLVNYPPLKDLSLLKDNIIFMTHQLHVIRKHEGSNPFLPNDFFLVHSPQRPSPPLH